MIKVYEIILTYDTKTPNQKIESEVKQLIEKINEILAKEIPDLLPQIFKDSKKKTKIAIVPINPDEIE